ncbi:MAG: VCBS repeat-containing protein [Candidatus Marinimicrobia bacterium]|nr:VCBS repeat-containing protein [Candidatus Neomarinimicrobiota bacterium]
MRLKNISFLLLLTTIPLFLSAKTLNVPSQYTTIQSAILFATDGDTVLVADGTYTEWDIDFLGKAIVVISENGKDVTIIDCQSNGGGFIFSHSEDSTSVLSGFTITRGSTNEGGGIYCSGSSPTITNCIITDNSADGSSAYGGGINISSGSPTITGCNVTGNSADGSFAYGGGIAISSGSPTITNCIITDNSADGSFAYGGGIYISSGSPTITDCNVTGNSSSLYNGKGGGIHISGGSATITNCTIGELNKPNTAMNGAGIYITGDSPSITGCVIKENTISYSGGDGGGINSSNSSATIQNCVIVKNSVSGGSDAHGGGVYCSGINIPTFINNTIAYNTASGNGGGIYHSGSSTLEVRNTIVWGDTAGNPSFNSIYSANYAITYTDAEGGWPGEGNLNSDPLFVYVSSDSFNLSDFSPCIGAGTSEGAPTTDIDGNPRPNPPSSIPDMGAYESPRSAPLSPDAPTNLTVSSGNTQLTLSWTASTAPSVDRYYIYRSTTEGFTPSGVADTIASVDDSLTSFADQNLTNGTTYYYRVSAVDGLGNESDYSDETSGTPSPVMLTVKKDGTGNFTTIQAAIDASAHGDTVLVHPGTYIENINFNGKNIVVGSLFLTTQDTSYISQTVIDGNQSGSVVIIDAGQDSTTILQGLTIQNGSATYGGGIYLSNSSPSLLNLNIRENETVSWRYGGGIYCYNSSPRIKNVMLSRNSAAHGGGMFLDHYSSPTLENAVISGNTATYAGGIWCEYLSNPILYNATLTENTNGGIILSNSASCVVMNTIFWNNSPNIEFREIYASNTITISYSDIQGGRDSIVTNSNGTVNWGSGNIDVDPEFVDLANGDYHLTDASPCIGAGTNTIQIDGIWYYAPDTDFDGNPRPNPAGSNPDMGTYENNRAAPVGVSPEPPQNLTATPGNQQITLYWYANTEPDLHKYNIYRDTSSPATILIDSCVASSPPDTVYVDTGLTNEQIYYYRITAVDDAGNESEFSDEISIIPELFTEQFTEQTGISLTGVYNSSVAWGDYDNDGDLDILLTGITGSSAYVSKIYRNNGDNSFTEQTGISLTGVGYCSVAWGDYDNDGDLDILLTGYTGSYNYVSKIYRNDGSNSFTEQTVISLPGVEGSVAWGDYDNDGDLDILLTGRTTDGSPVSKIYRNNGNNSFTEQTGINLTGVTWSSVAWGDYDNDGDLDILLTGDTGSGSISKIYRNNGNNSFTEQTGISLKGVYLSSVAWGDYDNDGDLDILLTGYGLVSKIYRNNGNNSFTEQTGISLTGVDHSSVAWGDYDNDGDLDILLTGDSGSSIYISKIYRNNGNNSFTEQTEISLTGVGRSSVWGDYDNDGDLDILLTGEFGGGVSKIYRNNNLTPNSVPTAPSGLTTSVTDSNVTFNWDKSTDAETLQNGLTYNLRVGTTPGGCEIKSPMADISSGYRKVVQLGNMNHCNSYILKSIPDGKYYWSVQAIDNAFAGSSWAAEDSFKIDTTPPTAPQNLSTTPGNQQITLRWDTNTESDLHKYNVYRDISSPATTLIDSCVASSPPDTFYVDTGLTNGQTYYYRITAVDSAGNESVFSNEVNATPRDTTQVIDYYVDRNNGSNVTGDGTESNPWETISFALSQITGTDHTVHVKPGIYDRTVGSEGWCEIFPITMKDGVSLIGAGADTTILDAGDNGYTLLIKDISDSSTTVKNFTITGGNPAGIKCENASAVVCSCYILNNSESGLMASLSSGDILQVKNNIIENNGETSGNAYGIYCSGGNLIIINNTIKNNIASGYCYGICCQSSGHVVIRENQIRYNGSSSASWEGYGILISADTVIVVDNEVEANRGEGGAGICCGGSWDGYVRVDSNQVSSNNEGIRIHSWFFPPRFHSIIRYNTIFDNHLTGIVASYGSTEIFKNLIFSNSDYGLDIKTTDRAEISYNLVFLNDNYGFILSGSDSTFVFNNTIHANSGGISISQHGPLIVNNIISENTGYGIYETGENSDPNTCAYNCFYGNTNLYYDEGLSAYSSLMMLENFVPECSNNLICDPLFLDPGSGDFHLSWANFPTPDSTMSPCINAGDPDLDGDGITWVDDPDDQDPDGTRLDMGALYFDQTGIPPKPPAGLSATPRNHQIILRWDQNTESDLHKYNIYRDTSSPATTLIDSVVASSPPDTFYVDTDILNGQMYYYRVTAVDSIGNESGFSNEDSAKWELNVSINPMNLPEYSQSVEFDYQIGNSLDNPTDLICRYSADNGNNWNVVSTDSDTTGITVDNYSGKLEWNSQADLPIDDIFDLLFAITPSDNGIFGKGDTVSIHLDNNKAPLIVISDLPGEQHNDIAINYQLSDAENDTLSILCEYYDETLKNWIHATITGNTEGITQYSNSVIWQSRIDLPEAAQYILFRITPTDNDIGLMDTTKILLDNLGVPSIAITTVIEGELSGDVRFDYVLSDDEGDTLTIYPEYSTSSGMNWNIATITGDTSNIGFQNYIDSLIWNSESDLPGIDLYTVRFRITPKDVNTGIPDQTPDFHLDNNAIPEVSLAEIPGVNTGDIPINYTLSDTEGDTLDIFAEYFDKAARIFKPATVSGTMANLDSSQYSGDIIWRSLEDFANIADTVQFRMTAMDNDTGLAYTIAIFVDNSLPAIALDDISGEQSGDVLIPYEIANDSLTTVSLHCEYSIDSGNNWSNASVTGDTSDIGFQNYIDSLIWNSESDLPGIDLHTVRFRITPKDVNTGIPDETADFHLDNNDIPEVTLAEIPGVNTGDIPINYTLSDTEGDTLDIFAEYFDKETDLFKPATITGDITDLDSTGYAGMLVWNSREDIPNVTDTILFSLTPADNDTGYTDTISVFVDNNVPSITLKDIEGEQTGGVLIHYTIDNDSLSVVSIHCEYSIDGSNNWKIAAVDGDTSDIDFNNYIDSLIWNSMIDLNGLDLTRVTFKITPYDISIGFADSTNAFHLDNNDIPVVDTLFTPFSEKTGDIELQFIVTDAENDTLNYLMQYSTDSGNNWNATSISFNYNDIPAPKDTLSFIWHSDQDTPNLDISTVMFQVTPLDNDTGLAGRTGAFHVDNETGPIVIGNYPKEFALWQDTIIIDFDRRIDTTSLPGNIEVSGTRSGEISGKNLFPDNIQSLFFIPGNPFMAKETLSVKLGAGILDSLGKGLDGDKDGDPEGSPIDDYSWQFTSPYLGDYDNSDVIDVQDLIIFSEEWSQEDQNLLYEIGPALGELPYLDLDPDGVIDFEDFVTLARMWNYTVGLSKISTLFAENPDENDLTGAQQDIENTRSLAKIPAITEETRPVITSKYQSVKNKEPHIPMIYLNPIISQDPWNNSQNGSFEVEIKTDQYMQLKGSQIIFKYNKDLLRFDGFREAAEQSESMAKSLSKSLESQELNNITGISMNSDKLILQHEDESTVLLDIVQMFGESEFVDENDNILILQFSAVKAGVSDIEYFYSAYGDEAELLDDGYESVQIDSKLLIPESFAIYQNYPNPFNPVTIIKYQIPIHSKVSVYIYDIQGRLVSELISKEHNPGYYSVNWNGKNRFDQMLSSGVYFYQIRAQSENKSFLKTKKMMILK